MLVSSDSLTISKHKMDNKSIIFIHVLYSISSVQRNAPSISAVKHANVVITQSLFRQEQFICAHD